LVLEILLMKYFDIFSHGMNWIFLSLDKI